MSGQYYVWEFGGLENDTRKPPSLDNFQEIETHFDDMAFDLGKKIESSLPVIKFTVNANYTFTDYQFNIPGYPLFSPDLKKALENFGITGIQYFPTQFAGKTGNIIRSDFFVTNVTTAVSCFDWERSKYNDDYRSSGFASDIEKLVLDYERIKGYDLFRISESPGILIISKALRQHLDATGISGIKFIDISEYKD